ncbi:MAG TPA: metallophosphoesterase [Candidatus Polarisedimenticolaceae bacterium]
MATHAIGDVHGNLPALVEVLEHLRREARPADTVVFLGDYIDRGPDSKGCIDAILRFRRESDAEVVCLMGNHEEWFLETLRDPRRHSWLLGMEGLDTIRSYSTEAADLLREAALQAGHALFGGECELPYGAFFDLLPADHVEFFEGLQVFRKTDDGIFAHGGLDPAVRGCEGQDREAFLWGAREFPHEYDGDDVVVYGHHNNYVLDDSGWPLPSIVGRTIGIDTISQGVLTAIRLPDRALFQSARHLMPKGRG